MNKTVLIGRLTKNIELSKTQSGKSFARFILAVNRRFKNEQGQQDADFISCVVWDKRAETMYQYLSKGSQIGIEGRIQTGSYERDGQRVYTTDIVVENFDFLESKNSRSESSNNETYYEQPTQETQSKEEYEYNYNFNDEPVLDINSDDLPF